MVADIHGHYKDQDINVIRINYCRCLMILNSSPLFQTTECLKYLTNCQYSSILMNLIESSRIE